MSDLWAANAHQFGPGKVHIIDDDDAERTLCGKALAAVPGKLARDEDANCKVCLTAVLNRAKRERWTEESKQRQAEYEQQRANENAQWWERYRTHLASPRWARLREKVFERAQGICEGCRETRATQVHHLTYQHMGNEFLWELVAVCRACHERNHEPGQSA